MESKTELIGVKGWLLFLVIVLTVIGPARGAWSVSSQLESLAIAEPALAASEAWIDVYAVAWVAWGFGAILSFVAGLILLFWRKAVAVITVIALLWIMGPLLSVFVVFDTGAEFDSANSFAVAKSAASALLWTFYLMNSQRVKNTYSFKGWQKVSASSASLPAE